ncbi:DUF2231 domain-containing protein [Cellulomonas sp. C5510]|uniref:DUF2231 domain-containing protein n=1 Tax=Cellulomonas sp. C5510 TaxID=2871170 RepID=UPI001C97489E|nr:DUF2231 domain-containing protein [Cellulomonas sp. C5510]QZN85194.1 DUF2231 domain-containing protein [Cellulomonas sp. C5510]
MSSDESPALRAVRRLEQATGVDAAVDRLQPAVLSALRAAPGVARLLHGVPLGHAAHPLLTDLPIGFWVSSTVLDLAGGRGLHRAADRLLGLGVLSAVPASVTGVADWAVSDRRAQRVGAAHAALNNVALGLYGASWLLRRRGRRGLGVAVALGAGGVLGASGYLGGHMVSRLGAPPRTASGPAEPATDRVLGGLRAVED